MGMETTMFFTFWGLKAIQKGNTTGKGLFGRMLGLMNRGGIDRVGPSRFNFGGLGRWMFKKMMRDQNVTSLPEMLQMAIDLDVKMLACLMSMDVMEINQDDLIDEVDDVVGAATMLAEAQESTVQYFI
jgi:peroxiredoxin family protein